MQTGIYRIRHVATDRCYIGQAINFKRRWQAHRRHLANGTHHNPHLLAAWRKYGSQAFAFETLIVCAAEDLDLYEQVALDTLKPVFNWAKTASTRRGVPMSDSAKAKIGAASRGKPRPARVRAAISAGLTGKITSAATRAKQRQAKLGLKMSKAARRTMSKAQRTRTRPVAEYASRRGGKRPLEVVLKSAKTRTGAKRTKTMRARMRVAALKMTPAKRLKIANARRKAQTDRTT